MIPVPVLLEDNTPALKRKHEALPTTSPLSLTELDRPTDIQQQPCTYWTSSYHPSPSPSPSPHIRPIPRFSSAALRVYHASPLRFPATPRHSRPTVLHSIAFRSCWLVLYQQRAPEGGVWGYPDQISCPPSKASHHVPSTRAQHLRHNIAGPSVGGKT